MVIYSYFLSISPKSPSIICVLPVFRVCRVPPLSDMINFIPFMFLCPRQWDVNRAKCQAVYQLSSLKYATCRRSFPFKIINIVRMKLISFLIRRILLMNINRCTCRCFHIKFCTVCARFFLQYFEYIHSF